MPKTRITSKRRSRLATALSGVVILGFTLSASPARAEDHLWRALSELTTAASASEHAALKLAGMKRGSRSPLKPTPKGSSLKGLFGTLLSEPFHREVNINTDASKWNSRFVLAQETQKDGSQLRLTLGTLPGVVHLERYSTDPSHRGRGIVELTLGSDAYRAALGNLPLQRNILDLSEKSLSTLLGQFTGLKNPGKLRKAILSQVRRRTTHFQNKATKTHRQIKIYRLKNASRK